MTNTEAEQSAKFYAIADTGDPEPWALVRVPDRGGLYEMWDGAEWVDMPFFATYFSGGEAGAVEVEEGESEMLKSSIRPPLPGAVAMLRGDGKGVGKPEPSVPDDEDTEADDDEDNDEDISEPEIESSQVSDGEPKDTEADDDEDDDEDEPKPGKPKKGVNPFPKKE